MKFHVDQDIRRAETLPASFYQDPSLFEALRERVFLQTWQWIGDQSMFNGQVDLYPFFFIDHYMPEPLVLSKNAHHQIKCLSNVCTHRANIMIHHPTKSNKIICNYHGRRFDKNGRFEWMPEFKEAADFPRACDHLKEFSFLDWHGQYFVGLEPTFDLKGVLNKMEERIGFLPLEQFKRHQKHTKDYLINTHWALYCDNYLEGFHIPFVHPGLNDALDYGSYETEVHDHMVLQIGYAADDKECFDLPKDHPDHGKHVAAFYYWIFPNFIFNFYPWGMSVNVVRPISMNRTRISFISFVYDESLIEIGAGAQMDKTEREDEFVVENVHLGLKSRYYQTGRFSPKREKGVHYFHQLLAKYVSE